MAISERSLFEVQEYINEILYPFSPNTFHKDIPLFVWKTIATTNYDLIIERAYNDASERVQNLVPFTKNGECIESKLSKPNDLIYMKLHGSITSVNDPDLPLILTAEQYVTHRKNRSRLFERLQDLAYEFSILFVGYGLADFNIRTIMMELGEVSDTKPRSYLIDPTLKPEQIRFWESRKITGIPITFENFLSQLNTQIPPDFRSLAKMTLDLPPIQKRFTNADIVPSESLRNFLSKDVDYIHNSFKTENIDPKTFYRCLVPECRGLDKS